jgi:hypothetical protein
MEGADDIGLNKIFRPMNAAVNVTFSRKINHRARLVFGEQLGHKIEIANAALHKNMARITVHRSKVFQIARVGQIIKIDNGLIALGQPIEDKVTADKAGGSGD